MRMLTAVLITAFLLTSCGKGADPAAKKATATTPPRLLLAAEDIRTVQASALASGPVITGSIQPARRADLRAEVAAVVQQVLKENGEPVRAGELLVRLDDTSIRDTLNAAEEALRAATLAFDQADRQVSRQKTLQAQGMVSSQAMEDAEVRRNAAQSEVLAARARVASARQQMQRTAVRAPFDGVLSERRASVGDTVQMGKELVKVIDPRSMRFEGLVSADRVQALKLGQPVRFRVNGAGQSEFAGTLKRIDATANAATRQVEVLVAFDQPADAPKVAGLFAEGHIETGQRAVLSVPESVLVRTPDAAYVWLMAGDRLARTAVKLGERDTRSGEVAVLEGVAAGDRILRNPNAALVDGQGFDLAENLSATPAPAETSVAR